MNIKKTTENNKTKEKTAQEILTLTQQEKNDVEVLMKK